MRAKLLSGVFMHFFVAAFAQAQNSEVKKYDSTAASFPGGQVALLNYLQQSLKYPLLEQQHGINAHTTVHFVVAASGKLVKFRFDDTTLNRFNVESERVLREGPKWQPAKVNGEDVRSEVSLPIHYEIAGEDYAPRSHNMQPVTYADEYPTFEGTTNDFIYFINKNIQRKVSFVPVLVRTEFMVSKYGYLQDPIVVNDCDEEWKKEALRILNEFPKWIPASTNGKAVDCKMRLNFVFKRN